MVVVLPMQSVPITSNLVSSNPVHGEVYSIQHYVIKFVIDLRQFGDFRFVVGSKIPQFKFKVAGVISHLVVHA
jgi:hypothetical protein